MDVPRTVGFGARAVALAVARAVARAVAVLAVLVMATACSGGGGGSDRPVVYVSVGASETVGVGADKPADEAWPTVFHRHALDGRGRYVNVGISGATVEDALRRELARAVKEEPTLATVWLNVNDIIRLVPANVYEQRLRELVHGLRRGGRCRVLVANTPPLDRLPAYTSRLRSFPFLPGPEAVNGVVDQYNAAIDRVARDEGAEVVDLHGLGLAARAAGVEASYVSADGFHPSTAGHRAVAGAFATAYRR